MSHRRIQEVNTALRESEQRYRNLVDTARDVILLKRGSGAWAPP
jgi:PAS domain-containing protein